MKTIHEEKIAVMQAFVNGSEIEYRPKRPGSEWVKCINPIWSWNEDIYRIKSEPKYRAWRNADEVPTDGLLRHKMQSEGFSRILSCSIDGLVGHIVNGVFVRESLQSLFEDRIISLDEGLTWLPCGIKE